MPRRQGRPSHSSGKNGHLNRCTKKADLPTALQSLVDLYGDEAVKLELRGVTTRKIIKRRGGRPTGPMIDDRPALRDAAAEWRANGRASALLIDAADRGADQPQPATRASRNPHAGALRRRSPMRRQIAMGGIRNLYSPVSWGFDPAGAAHHWIRWREEKNTDCHQEVAHELRPLLEEKYIICQRNVNSRPSSVSLVRSKYFSYSLTSIVTRFVFTTNIRLLTPFMSLINFNGGII